MCSSDLYGGFVFASDARFQTIEDMRAEALPLTFGEHVHTRDVVSVSAAHADNLALVQEHVPVAGLYTLLHVLVTVQLAEKVDDFGWVIFGIYRADRGLHDVVNPVDMLWTSGNVFHVAPSRMRSQTDTLCDCTAQGDVRASKT